MEKNVVMGPRFRRVERDQQFLLPPDVREWLPVGHPALFVVEVVSELDLSGFVDGYRSSRDRGRPAYHPEVMVGILLYASMTATMSSRRIEQLLATDVGFRVVAANERPDHGTICRFLARHGDGLQAVFAQVVALAAQAGLVDVTMVAVDGTTMAGDASLSRNVDAGELRARFKQWAEQVEANDTVEDADDTTGPIEEMSDPESMRAWIREHLHGVDTSDSPADDPSATVSDDSAGGEGRVNVVDPDSAIMPRKGGGWVQGYNAQAAAVAGGIVVAADVTNCPADSTMLEPMVRRITNAVEQATGEDVGVIVADAGYWDSATIDAIETDDRLADVLVATGRQQPSELPAALPEPDLAGYHAELGAHEARVAAEHARRVEIIERVLDGELLLREAAPLMGRSIGQVSRMATAYRNGGVDALPPPKLTGRPKAPRGPTLAARCRHAMATRLAKPAGRSLYRQRQGTIEPVFGDIKTNRRITRFTRRGLDKVTTEWHWILTGHNLTILHHHTS
jgi:transposase